MAARPLVLPEPFNGESNWEEWTHHFENVAAVNEWDNANKLKWLKVRLTGRAQTAFQHLPEETREDYKQASRALKERFEPASRKCRYQAEFQTKRKKKTEGWADYAEELRSLANKAYPELNEDAREQLALHNFLGQIGDPLIAFNVKQKSPATLDEAVSATLTMEAYADPRTQGVAAATGGQPEGATLVAATEQKSLVNLLERLVDRVDKLEAKLTSGPTSPAQYLEPGSTTAARHPRHAARPRGFSGACWVCGRRGHRAKDCWQRDGQQRQQRWQEN